MLFVFVFVFAAEEYGGLHESLIVEAPLFIEFAILPDVPWTDHELVKQGNFMRTKYNKNYGQNITRQLDKI